GLPGRIEAAVRDQLPLRIEELRPEAQALRERAAGQALVRLPELTLDALPAAELARLVHLHDSGRVRPVEQPALTLPPRPVVGLAAAARGERHDGDERDRKRLHGVEYPVLRVRLRHATLLSTRPAPGRAPSPSHRSG